MDCREGEWLPRLEWGRGTDGASGLAAPQGTGAGTLGCVVKVPVRACFPRAGGSLWVSRAAASKECLWHPVHSKIKNEWIPPSLWAGVWNDAATSENNLAAS